MSRIEKALEKAVKLRDGKTGGVFSGPAARRQAAPGTSPVSVSHSCIITLKDPASAIAEEYRKLKSMVVKLTKQGGFRNTLMVTSSLAREGKSITAVNLAITLSQEFDHTVLLVDADFRKPSLHHYFNFTPDAGLADCIADDLDTGQALIKTGIGKLSLLPAGKSVTNPVELLSSQRMKEIVSELKHRYADRYIIVDSPPILPFAETHALSSMVDGVVFVVKEGLASIESIGNALELLSRSSVLGIVYNDAGVENIIARDNAKHYFSGYGRPAEAN